jgi:hypothetical protein
MHHEKAATRRFGDHHFSVFLLLGNHCYEHDICTGFGDAKVLKELKLAAFTKLKLCYVFPLLRLSSICSSPLRAARG